MITTLVSYKISITSKRVVIYRSHLTLALAFLCSSLLVGQSAGTFFELGYNINTTFLEQSPKVSPITTLQERKAINGFHLALGQKHWLSNSLQIEYSLIYDLLGFDALIEQDRHKESSLGIRLLIQHNLTEKLKIAAGAQGYFKSWGDPLDITSIHFDPFLKQNRTFLTATVRLSFHIKHQIGVFAAYNHSLIPVYKYDFPSSQFPLNLKLYFRFIQVGATYLLLAN